MKWQKLGLIFKTKKNNKWMQSHSTLPTAHNINGDLYRIYFSSRDSYNKSNGAFIDINIFHPKKILKISENPILSPGTKGAFDEKGVQPCAVLKVKNKIFMYYTGWSSSDYIPYRTNIGLAISKNGTNAFEKIIRFSNSSFKVNKHNSIGWAEVLFNNGNFKMWYEDISWKTKNTLENITPTVKIKYATSKNGTKWHKKDMQTLCSFNDLFIISRPSIIFKNNHYKMWYSFKKSNKYQIGYAESKDGIDWIRKDRQVGITVSKNGWDNEQIEYPNVFDHKGDRYMLYNGNDYGKSGFGLARLIK